MGEHYANIYRLADLRAWHALTVTCGRCRHRHALSLGELMAQHPDLVWLHEVEPWLACPTCGNRERNRVQVVMGSMPTTQWPERMVTAR